MEDKSKLFSIRIKKLRQDKSLTGEELGKIMGVSKVSVWQWENDINYPNNKILLKLASFFNVSTDYLLGLSDTPNPQETLDDIQLDDFQFALYGEVKDLTEEQKQTLLNMAKFLKDSNNSNSNK